MIAKVSAICFAGARGGDRTRGLLIRSETLYPLSYERMYFSITECLIAAASDTLINLHASYGLVNNGIGPAKLFLPPAGRSVQPVYDIT